MSGVTPSEDAIHDVAIVGYGPVGAVAANLHGMLGHRTAVFETTRGVHHLPRAAHYDAEIMRVFQAFGSAEATLSAGTPVRGMHFLNGDRKKLFGFDAPDGPTHHGWPSGFMFYQPDLEKALRAGVDTRPTVDVHLEHEVLGFTEEHDHVALRVRDLVAGRERIVRARWLLGCDGARSLVRREAGLELDDLGFDQPWLVVDLLLKRAVDLPLVCQQICDPARPVTFVPSAGAHRRWEFMLMPGEDAESIQREERIHSLLEPWLAKDDAEIIRAAVYSFHAVVARSWRAGRALLVGDSAHQMPPFLGQGMCSGIRDAANLAWRLDLVLRGLAESDLLDGYEVEREPHVRKIVELAVNFGKIIQTTDRAIAAQRDAQFLSNATSLTSQEFRMPSLGAGLRVPRAGAGDAAGSLFPQSRVRTAAGDVRLLDDVLGYRFVLVQDAEAPHLSLPEAFVRAGAHSVRVARKDAQGVGEVPGSTLVTEVDDVVVPWLARHGAMLVRPDRYVLGTATSEAHTRDWAEAFARALGHPAAGTGGIA